MKRYWDKSGVFKPVRRELREKLGLGVYFGKRSIWCLLADSVSSVAGALQQTEWRAGGATKVEAKSQV